MEEKFKSAVGQAIKDFKSKQVQKAEGDIERLARLQEAISSFHTFIDDSTLAAAKLRDELIIKIYENDKLTKEQTGSLQKKIDKAYKEATEPSTIDTLRQTASSLADSAADKAGSVGNTLLKVLPRAVSRRLVKINPKSLDPVELPLSVSLPITEAQQKAEAERLAKLREAEEADRKAKEEAAERATEEAARAKREAEDTDRRAQEEAANRAAEEEQKKHEPEAAEGKAREEAEAAERRRLAEAQQQDETERLEKLRAAEDTGRRAQEEAARKAAEEEQKRREAEAAERKAREEAARKEAERKAQETAAERKRLEEERIQRERKTQQILAERQAAVEREKAHNEQQQRQGLERKNIELERSIAEKGTAIQLRRAEIGRIQLSIDSMVSNFNTHFIQAELKTKREALVPLPFLFGGRLAAIKAGGEGYVQNPKSKEAVLNALVNTGIYYFSFMRDLFSGSYQNRCAAYNTYLDRCQNAQEIVDGLKRSKEDVAAFDHRITMYFSERTYHKFIGKPLAGESAIDPAQPILGVKQQLEAAFDAKSRHEQEVGGFVREQEELREKQKQTRTELSQLPPSSTESLQQSANLRLK